MNFNLSLECDLQTTHEYGWLWIAMPDHTLGEYVVGIATTDWSRFRIAQLVRRQQEEVLSGNVQSQFAQLDFADQVGVEVVTQQKVSSTQE